MPMLGHSVQTRRIAGTCRARPSGRLHVRLPTLLQREAVGSLHFYLANLSGLRRALFPALSRRTKAGSPIATTANSPALMPRAEAHC